MSGRLYPRDIIEIKIPVGGPITVRAHLPARRISIEEYLPYLDELHPVYAAPIDPMHSEELEHVTSWLAGINAHYPLPGGLYVMQAPERPLRERLEAEYGAFDLAGLASSPHDPITEIRAPLDRHYPPVFADERFGGMPRSVRPIASERTP